MDKNEKYVIEIEDMTEDGSGIGRIDGLAVFVKDTAPGDKAEVLITKVKKNLAYARLVNLLEPAPSRITPACPVARQCGGCTLQHISYKRELELKRDRVLNCLSRIGGIEEPGKYLEDVYGYGCTLSELGDKSYLECETVTKPVRYRNKMQFPAGRDKEGNIRLGFYAGRTHSLIPLDDCINGHEVNEYIISAICNWAEKEGISIYNEETRKGLLRHVLTRVGYKTGELMVCLVINGDNLPKNSEEGLKKVLPEAASKSEGITLKSVVINKNKKNTNKILGEETYTIYGDSYITDYIGDIGFQISAQSFFQVNPVQTEKLYQKALDYASLTGEENVWDMYCGIGTISLFLSQRAKEVYGVEIVPQAIQDAEKNAELNQIENVQFFTGKAEEVVPAWQKESAVPIDVVVVDPPRKGCDETLLQTIVEIKPDRMVYVSCDPATLARDLKILLEQGFTLEKLSIYDQFCRSSHVETVVLMSTDFSRAQVHPCRKPMIMKNG